MELFILFNICSLKCFSFVLDELTMKNQYFASLNISVCLEAEQECGVVIQVLNETLLPKEPCDWTTGFLQQSKFFVSIYVIVLKFQTLVACQKGLDKQCRPRSDCF